MTPEEAIDDFYKDNRHDPSVCGLPPFPEVGGDQRPYCPGCWATWKKARIRISAAQEKLEREKRNIEEMRKRKKKE